MTIHSGARAVAPPLLAGRSVTSAAAARVTIDGQPYLNFFGNGYLALTEENEIREAARRALERGAPFARQFASALGTVDPIFDEIERLGAEACGTEASVYFASGYLIGAVGIASLAQSFQVLLLDESAHYSLQDAARATGLPHFLFMHGDPDSLKDRLRQHVRGKQRPLVLTDGVFATTGYIPPLADYATVLAPYDGRIFVDESHGFGVVGLRGRGAIEHCAVENIATGGATLSKAFCTQGAIVGCTHERAARLQTLPPIRGACAGSPLSAAAAAASLRFVARRPELRSNLRGMTSYFRIRLRELGLDVIESPAPIVSFRSGIQADMLALQRRLFDHGIFIYHSTYIGAGPEGMIRCAVFRDHTREDIDSLIAALRQSA